MNKINDGLIGITMGDASGVGPELILKAWQAGALSPACVVFGDYEIMKACDQMLGYQVKMRSIHQLDAYDPDDLNIFDLKLMKASDLKVGQIDRLSGYAASEYVRKAVHLALEGHIAAIVTLPVNKEATRLSLPGFSGHTELIAGLCQQQDYTMMLTGSKLTVSHVSTHVSMEMAVKAVKETRILKVIELTYHALRKYIASPRLAVAGLNPHAGEGGAFGDEELKEILPAVKQACEKGIDCKGPIAPDTVFLKAVQGQFDAVICMYHDQGHIPMKLLDFEGGVNVTLGLKVIRTSVDHGTAFDIAYKSLASAKSLAAAYQLAVKMSGGNQETPAGPD